MSLLKDFTPFNFSEGAPYISVTNNGLTFNKSVIMKLGRPQYVLLLIDEATKRIAIQECTQETANAAAFFKEKKSGVLSVRWNGRDLINTIQNLTGWNLSKGGYRVDGVLLRDDHAMLFDLNTAVELK